MVKKLFTALFAASLSILTAATSFAGSWQQDSYGWWYQNDNGSYPANCWQWIDGNNDNIAEAYFFDENGYCLTNASLADNYCLNENGALVIDGVVQTKNINDSSNATEKSTTTSTNQQKSASSTQSSTTNVGSTVWISETGSKYHRINNCGKMNPANARSMSKSDAEQMGYKPCSKCY